MPDIPRGDVASLLKIVQSNTLLNRQLSTICQLNGLTSSGVKANLQGRIVNLIQETVNARDLTRFRQIEQSIKTIRANGTASPAKSAQAYTQTMPSHSHRQQAPYYGLPSPGIHGSSANGYRGTPSQLSLQFKPSPFYEVLQPSIGPVLVCEPMQQHRNVVTIRIRASEHPLLQQASLDTSLRAMVFCAGSKDGVQEIAFPHQSEIKVNGGEIKANLRGLKNKPGSTRPVDITNALRPRPTNYDNTVELIYALTKQPFYVAVYFCKITSVQDLVTRIKSGKRIPKASVIQEITNKAADADIVTTSQVLSLKCPLSYMRLELPCRSLICSHIQCFDATSYLQLQEQGPQWLCPICNKSATFETLAVDEYVKEILTNTSSDLDQVTIEPDAKWRVPTAQNGSAGSRSRSNRFEDDDDDDDDDDLEISEVNVVGGRKMETPSRSLYGSATPTTQGGSSLPRGLGSTSGKRPAQVVVDLTLDSDDEDGPPPTKKHHTAPSTHSMHPRYY
ncbi:MIZ zinc finger protein [Sodiomyces alkalinus F11]|uniref:MIZ zinc finger protein n=1 Tax=Sodiomyces alkalinus (strain CBS 110278 / VKM F-3762 / F11) TaxID=1314773 RepID=A0A3N2PWE6_SODAK|nr:MIZ zinc finger protein [Sodiomyces alkalinus F11]ROT38814.1 MIZ zinc finger protein [Sodiomyces alkalinus F11]